MLATILVNSKSPLPTNRAFGLLGFAVLVVSSLVLGLRADGTQQAVNSRDEALANRRFDLMQKRVAAAKARSGEADFPEGFAARPIFKYSDPARGYVAAAVWKLGEQGRPRALVATELDRCDHGKPCISYEYLSMTETPFSVRSEDIDWAPSGTLFEFKPIPKAPAPAETPQLRLRQLREAARRFGAHEEVKDVRCELRILPTPVDRYSPSKVDRADGAIFFFTFGTNPEVVLLIESDGKQWRYAAGRLTGAQVVVLTLDDTIAWEGAPCQPGRDSPFTGSITPIAIPGIAEDGSEIKESENPR